MSIYLGNIPTGCTQEEITGLFSKYGKVESVKLIRYLSSGKPLGFGFVTMPEKSEKEAAINALHHYNYKGVLLVVTKAIEREPANT